MNNEKINKASKAELRSLARTGTQSGSNFTLVELMALNQFAGRTTFGQLESNHEATALRKLYILTGKMIEEATNV